MCILFRPPDAHYLDLDAGDDFNRQIIVKVNVAEVLRTELAKPSWRREPVALGTNTDPYQRAEGRYALMPGIIEALAESGTPFSILTKGTLLRRDLPLLAEAAEHVPVDLAMSIAIYDHELQQSVEPGTPEREGAARHGDGGARGGASTARCSSCRSCRTSPTRARTSTRRCARPRRPGRRACSTRRCTCAAA